MSKTMDYCLGGAHTHTHPSQLLEAGKPNRRLLPCMGATRRLQTKFVQKRRLKALSKSIPTMRSWTHTMFLIFLMALTPCPRILQVYVSQCGCRSMRIVVFTYRDRAMLSWVCIHPILGLCRACEER